MEIERDFVVLGAGNAGLAAADIAKHAGHSVVVIESRDVGGTCPLRGCVPKKVLVAAAEVLDQITRADKHHINVGKAVLDWKKLIARKETFVDGVPEAFEQSLVKRGIEVVHSEAKFVGPNIVAANGHQYRSKKLLIATGSTPRTLPIPGSEHAVTSDYILSMKHRPASLVFIGGGVIAFELSHVLARAGTKVTILAAKSKPLPRLDEDVVKNLVDVTRRLGVDIVSDAKTEAIVSREQGYQVHFDYNGQKHVLDAELVVNVAGRVANIDTLDLEVAGIKRNSRGVLVDEYLRSATNHDVFAAGDVLSNQQLSPLATYEGNIVGHNVIRDKSITPDYTSIPSVVFTVPAVASIGLTENLARERGLKFNTKVNDMRDWRSARTHAETAAYAKVLIEDGNGKILGAHLLGHGAQETIHLFSLAMKYGITAGELAKNVYAYPTFSSDIKYLV